MEQVVVRTWGNSQGIRIPKNILDKLDIKVSDMLEMDVRNNTIILKKSFKHRSFEERLQEYNGEISVYGYDWGEPVGKEML